jgi:hypothetical protein
VKTTNVLFIWATSYTHTKTEKIGFGKPSNPANLFGCTKCHAEIKKNPGLLLIDKLNKGNLLRRKYQHFQKKLQEREGGIAWWPILWGQRPNKEAREEGGLKGFGPQSKMGSPKRN